MSSVFTKIINGELPGRFVWQDGQAVAFLTIEPVTPGHLLVVPRKEVDHWEQMDTASFTHLTDVAQKVGRAVKEAFDAPRMGLLIAGLEVPHVHIHVFPALSMETFDLTNARKDITPAELDADAEKIRDALRATGYSEYVND
ncbi:histidine triad (HIT)-like protein [Gordonia polyisoprenivorans VH2]|uniref:Histidine triad (HIT)-like protein n=2 Tax=Gordonia polyisoprenivorans TaxID=84595 RepID=H6MTZ7_GORPV|nr:HIT family protein [Gordonia polyisoprenivorans]AFA75228.1 histidine triad (HIT)-like protein [Gordonia polyisoprenivorans VH2]MBE7193174.1 HIT family protein [Gordonia polyisoprenivorans]NKY01619.1 HIT family protein [Gordonia polyisoprenivorans]OZC32169.1 HIT family protein [Gordonia polyisoprenivorans]QUD83491.1 HIT family protein [Gordonia polyisoprenivorans]